MTNGDKRLVLSCYITYSKCIITIVKECMVEIVKDNTPSYINYTLYTYRPSIQPKVGAAITVLELKLYLMFSSVKQLSEFAMGPE